MAGERGNSRGDTFDRRALVTASRNAGLLLRGAAEARARDGLTAEDLLIFLAVGHLGIDAAGEIPRMTPCTFLQIAEFLAVPRETVRRKIGRLCDRGFTRSGPAGIVVRDVDLWLRQASVLFARAIDDAGGAGDRADPLR
jgi:CRP-like cAMP-binding protein